ncbi:PREDICTED: amyloid beta A4 precursor protein-binding family B member 1-interacting protein-like [Camelina sativa]|uniref:Amyloid beta A4 precursor protein-binding family B member 1-interacting protein-like n=1 Tax=Camelina sativa TaxID=90675 RepID=A0ABM0VVH4_CAMSA|nr:PREDICTED: amyloid beta A4 precursor protein-binding family B member 1-interacting protein-like [Camelina sativa]
MTSLFLSISSHSRYLPMSSVAFLRLRPPRAPPPEPLSPPTPPEPPDPPDPQICFSFGESLAQPLSLSSFRACDLFVVPLPSTLGFPPPTDALTLPHQMFPQGALC